VVLIARLSLRDGDLTELRRVELRHLELRDVAAELVEALHRPRAHDAAQAMLLDAVALLQQIAELLRAEETKGRLEDRADHIARFEHVDRVGFHQLLEPLGERRLAAADWTQEVKDLALLFETLRRVLEVTDDTLDRV